VSRRAVLAHDVHDPDDAEPVLQHSVEGSPLCRRQRLQDVRAVGFASLDLTGFELCVWFSFALSRGASGFRPRGASDRDLRPTSGRRASARGRAARSPRARPGCGAARCGTSGTARPPRAGRSRCARRTGHRALRQRVDLEDLDFAIDHGHVAGVAQPQPNGRVAARFLPVGLSVGVATSSASPSQSKDSGTRYGARPPRRWPPRDRRRG
jgi:hypothetical protein